MSLNDQQNPDVLSPELSDPVENTLLASSSHNKNMDMVGDDEESVTTVSPVPGCLPPPPQIYIDGSLRKK